MDTPGTSSSSDKERMEAAETAITMLAQGKRNMVCGEIPNAVNQFQEACKVLAKAYGETAKECAEAYFYYGQSLLDLARMETGVLGNALQGVPEEEETEEDSKPSEQFEPVELNGNPDDISNLQLAWEMLELAKVIYLKEEDKKSKLKAAESFLKLGEISLETENYEQALSDFQECLKIQEAELEPDDRLLAETHYQLGLAHGFNKQYDESIDQYRKAIKVMEAKIGKLKKTVEDGTQGKGKEPQAADDPIKAAQQEIKDLEEILPDIRGKIEDMEEEKKNIDELKSITKDTLAAVASELKPAESSEPKKAASDISHLVRRKRKPEEESAEADTKKTRQEEGSGDTEKNGTANDKSESAMNPDDISNLQLAWEMLELAKVIYLKEEDKKSKLKAAESFLKLGEISLETENYEQALSDFQECLKIQEAELEPDDRLLAETYPFSCYQPVSMKRSEQHVKVAFLDLFRHYQLGLAHGFNKQYDESIDQYRKAIKVMEAKIGKLKKTVEDGTQGKGKEPQAADDPIKAAQQEIKDLEEILPDIRGKIEDMEEEKKNIDELKSITKDTLAAVASELKPAESSEPKKAASDISHLVRRKRKPEEESAEADTKKTRQEEGSGDTEKNGTANDKSESAMESDTKKKESMDVSEPPTAVAS
uniref:Nuclear autoantigenic sperm protein n=1 Tax=Magallana gigas TaxID=29159 RepID=K1RN77_MAGGI